MTNLDKQREMGRLAGERWPALRNSFASFFHVDADVESPEITLREMVQAWQPGYRRAGLETLLAEWTDWAEASADWEEGYLVDFIEFGFGATWMIPDGAAARRFMKSAHDAIVAGIAEEGEQ